MEPSHSTTILGGSYEQKNRQRLRMVTEESLLSSVHHPGAPHNDSTVGGRISRAVQAYRRIAQWQDTIVNEEEVIEPEDEGDTDAPGERAALEYLGVDTACELHTSNIPEIT